MEDHISSGEGRGSKEKTKKREKKIEENKELCISDREGEEYMS